MFAVMQTRNSQVANPGCLPGCHKPETLLPLLVHSIYIHITEQHIINIVLGHSIHVYQKKEKRMN